jgi:hypothetical protein
MTADMLENLLRWGAAYIILWWVCKIVYHFFTDGEGQ